MSENENKIKVRNISKSIHINRLDNNSGKFYKDTHIVNLPSNATVLDALLKIKETKDATLSMRYSCRMGICGSCGMVIDGKPSLACQKLVSSSENDITVGPMLGHPVLKDLVDDFDDFFEKHKSIMPWMIVKNQNSKFHPKALTKQTPENVEKIVPFSSCIKCGLCLDACPVVNTNPSFVGPQALAQTHKLIMDSRDEAAGRRLDLVDAANGIWACEFIGACSSVCPKGVDPALAIQELKIESITEMIMGLRSKKRSAKE
jgi:succinate dehydrogenase / fumarate reductase, iron-sulfur subunit